MTLKTTLTIFVVLISAIFTALSISLIQMSDLLDIDARKLATAGESIGVAEEMKSRLLTHNRDTFLYEIHHVAVRLISVRAHRVQVMSFLETVEQLVNSEEEEAILANVQKEIMAYYEKRRQVSALGISPVERYNQVSEDVDEALTVIDRLIEVNLEQMRKLMEAIARQNKMADSMAVLLLLFGGFVLVSIIVGMIYFVARPLTALSGAISRYGAGDSSARTGVTGLHEIHVIGSAFNEMADRLDERRQEQLRFTASIAHDLRNPLNPLFIAADLLVAKAENGDRDLAGIIRRQVRSLDRLVSDLLDTTRIEAGQLDLEILEQDIRAVIKDSVELYKTSSDLHNFLIEMPDDPLLCECDARRVLQVINNLVTNAIKYSPGGGVVKVGACRKESEIIVYVSDQGIGIASEDLNNIFKPFHRTATTKGTIPGIGLGLSASRRIAQAHGGRLDVESTPGKGSTFYLVLPVRAGGATVVT